MKGLGGWIVAFAGAGALGVAGWWLRRPAGPAGEGGPAFGFVLPVTLAAVEVRDVQPRVPLTGTVRAVNRAALAFDASGLVESIEVEEGDAVDAGQILARLGRRDEELELDTARAALVRAERELALLQAGERAEEIRRLEAELEAAKAASELAELEVQRGEKLLADRLISQADQDARAAAYRAANRRQAAAFELHAKAVAGARPEDLAIAAAKVTEERASVATAEHDLAKTALVAPWAGVVTRRDLSPGDYVTAGTTVFEIVDLAHLEVHVEVPGHHAVLLGARPEVVVTVKDRADFALSTALDTMIPAADERSRAFRGIVRLGPGEAPEGVLRPGNFVGIELLLGRYPDSLAVPTDCVLAGDRGARIVRAVAAPPPAAGAPPAHPGPPPPAWVAEIVPVRVLAEADGFSAVESLGPPLAAGDRVVLAGADNAYPGAALLVSAAG
ncbi:MAG: HlyD family efflux transporter periplasmic adaptor subunit, partial [Planctomycetota bacterium]